LLEGPGVDQIGGEADGIALALDASGDDQVGPQGARR
jgi:hypothetical protein